MSYQNISAVLPGGDVQSIKDALNVVSSKLPFAVVLSKAEKKKLLKLADKSVPFVQDALLVAQSHPEILPSTFNAAEFAKDVALFAVLSEILLLIDSRAEAIRDTTTAVGNEAMKAGTQVYDYLKTAAKTTPGLKPLVDKLAARFVRPSSPSPSPSPPPGPPPSPVPPPPTP